MCLDDTTVRIPLRARDGSVRAYALVDAADAEWVNQWRWSLDSDGYAQRNTRRGTVNTTISLHRALLGCTPGDGVEIDHIDRNRLNCRRKNLRVLTKKTNPQNRPSDRGGTSSYRGVHWNKDSRKWRATVSSNGKTIHLGLFGTETEAAEAARAGRAHYLPYAVD